MQKSGQKMKLLLAAMKKSAQPGMHQVKAKQMANQLRYKLKEAGIKVPNKREMQEWAKEEHKKEGGGLLGPNDQGNGPRQAQLAEGPR